MSTMSSFSSSIAGLEATVRTLQQRLASAQLQQLKSQKRRSVLHTRRRPRRRREDEHQEDDLDDEEEDDEELVVEHHIDLDDVQDNIGDDAEQSKHASADNERAVNRRLEQFETERAKLLEACETALLAADVPDPSSVVVLWRVVFYPHLDFLRKHPELKGLLSQELDQAIGFFESLMVSLKFKHDIGSMDECAIEMWRAKLSSKSYKPIKMSVLDCCHRILVYLGDLHRYRESIDPLTPSPLMFYMQAVRIFPENGSPHAQIALYLQRLDMLLSSLCWYCLGLGTKNSPTQGIMENMKNIFTKLPKQLSVAKDPSLERCQLLTVLCFEKFLSGIAVENAGTKSLYEVAKSLISAFDAHLTNLESDHKTELESQYLADFLVIMIWSFDHCNKEHHSESKPDHHLTVNSSKGKLLLWTVHSMLDSYFRRVAPGNEIAAVILSFYMTWVECNREHIGALLLGTRGATAVGVHNISSPPLTSAAAASSTSSSTSAYNHANESEALPKVLEHMIGVWRSIFLLHSEKLASMFANYFAQPSSSSSKASAKSSSATGPILNPKCDEIRRHIVRGDIRLWGFGPLNAYHNGLAWEKGVATNTTGLHPFSETLVHHARIQCSISKIAVTEEIPFIRFDSDRKKVVLSSPEEEEQKRLAERERVMHAMAISRLQNEVETLEAAAQSKNDWIKKGSNGSSSSRSSRKNNSSSRKTAGRGDTDGGRNNHIWIVVDTFAFLKRLSGIKRLVDSGRHHIIVPTSVIGSLDFMKKGDDSLNVSAREAIRYLEQMLRLAQKNISLRIPAKHELIPTSWDEIVDIAVSEVDDQETLQAIKSTIDQPDEIAHVPHAVFRRMVSDVLGTARYFATYEGAGYILSENLVIMHAAKHWSIEIGSNLTQRRQQQKHI